MDSKVIYDPSDVTVAEGCGCPECGECRMDWLPWDEDDYVHCATCGHKYDPAETKSEANHASH